MKDAGQKLIDLHPDIYCSQLSKSSANAMMTMTTTARRADLGNIPVVCAVYASIASGDGADTIVLSMSLKLLISASK
jgi:hypothetical protein